MNDKVRALPRYEFDIDLDGMVFRLREKAGGRFILASDLERAMGEQAPFPNPMCPQHGTGRNATGTECLCDLSAKAAPPSDEGRIPPAAGGATTSHVVYDPTTPWTDGMGNKNPLAAAPVGEREEAALLLERHADTISRSIGGAFDGNQKLVATLRLAASALRSIESSEGAVAWLVAAGTDGGDGWAEFDKGKAEYARDRLGRTITPLFTRPAEVDEGMVLRGTEAMNNYWLNTDARQATFQGAMRAALEAALRRE